MAEDVARYAVRLVDASRPGRGPKLDFVEKWVKWGAGLRASQALILGAKARALIHGRYHVSVKDIQALAEPILRHRVIPNFYGEAEGITSDILVDRLLGGRAAAGQRPLVRRPKRHGRSRALSRPEAVLARIGSLDLKAKTVVEGVLSGLHRSPKPRLQRGVRRVPPVHARRRARHHRLEGLRALRPATTSRSSRKTPTSTAICSLDISGSMALRFARPSRKRDYACLPRRLARVSHASPARRGGPHRLRR